MFTSQLTFCVKAGSEIQEVDEAGVFLKHPNDSTQHHSTSQWLQQDTQYLDFSVEVIRF